jgi:hypothetical protein
VIPVPITNNPGNTKMGLKMTTTVRLVSMITAYAVKMKRRCDSILSIASRSWVNLVTILAVGVSSIQLVGILQCSVKCFERAPHTEVYWRALIQQAQR